MKWPRYLLSGMSVAFSLQTPGQASELQDAILAGKADAIEALLAAGADINEQGDLGTPLHVAAFDGNAELAKLIIHKRANIEAEEQSTRIRPSHTAASYGHANVVALLLEQGAQIDPREARERTPLFIAA
jgi:ankyrin repeat protein